MRRVRREPAVTSNVPSIVDVCGYGLKRLAIALFAGDGVLYAWSSLLFRRGGEPVIPHRAFSLRGSSAGQWLPVHWRRASIQRS